ncbi:hypothetical protein HD806DRAFT_519416 [Xylariaceae sp. AK1471]|nr:hypothetical protein HD806DRAFT_519416 [Xylariaceae sp. AK1471]
MTDASNPTPAVMDLYQLCLAADGPTKDAIRALLTNRPEHRPVTNILPIDELKQRLIMIEKLETDIANSLNRIHTNFTNFDSFAFAALLIVPLQKLQWFSTQQDIIDHSTCKTMMESIKPLMKIFLAHGGKLSGGDKTPSHHTPSHHTPSAQTPTKSSSYQPPSVGGSSQTSNKRRLSIDTSSKEEIPESLEAKIASSISLRNKFDSTGKLRRNEAEATKRKMLDDNACLITSTADPEVRHIIPFASCARPNTVATLRHHLIQTSRIFFSGSDVNSTIDLLANEVGGSDKAWNLLCLNQQLHFWWGKPYFGLKYLESEMSTENPDVTIITIQFQWLPKLQSRIPLQRDAEYIKRFLESETVPKGGVIKAFRGSGHPVQTGDTFRIKVSTTDADKMRQALNLQWALVRIAALTGGAEALELDDNDNDEPAPLGNVIHTEENRDAYVETWLQTVRLSASGSEDDIDPTKKDDKDDDDDDDDEDEDDNDNDERGNIALRTTIPSGQRQRLAERSASPPKTQSVAPRIHSSSPEKKENKPPT